MTRREERRIRLNFFGQEISLVTTASDAEVEEVVSLVRDHFSRLVDPSSRVVSNKVAILTCLNMASECVRLRRELERCRQEQRESVERLTKRIESCLELI